MVIIYSESKPAMAAQWIRFENAIYDAAGKLDPTLAQCILDRKPLTLGDFLPPPQDEGEYTIGFKDKGTTPIYDEEKKKLYDKAADLLMDKAVDAYTLHLKNWKSFFYRIKAQIDHDTTSRVEMSDDWAKIKQTNDTGGLMRLLQQVCTHGTDRDYLPERIFNCLSTLINTKQGKHNPSDFGETTTSNGQVLKDVVGATVFGHMPTLQEFIINRCSDLNFAPSELEAQSRATKELVYARCDDCMIGCIMTLRSNKEKSDMNTEVHKSLLSKHGEAFAMSANEAVDQMVGFELLKKNSGNSNSTNKQNRNTRNDTSSAVVLMEISDAAASTGPNMRGQHSKEFRCYHCGEPGHSQYNCPLLTPEERQAKYVENMKARETRSNENPSGNQRIEDAVHFAFSNDRSDNGVEPESGNAHDESIADRFIFCQITDEASIAETPNGRGPAPDFCRGRALNRRHEAR